jgi:phospho-N-acetylmuramoyl-pentapeptide-transferase
MGKGLSLLSAGAVQVSLGAAAGAFLVALLVSLALGEHVIGLLRQLKFGQRVRDDGPQRHLQKEGTPTMGGVLIVGATVLGALLVGLPLVLRAAGAFSPYGLEHLVLLMAGTIAFGAIGFADDWLKIKRGRSLGLKARQKLTMQFAVAAAFVVALILIPGVRPEFSAFSLVVAALWVFALAFTSNAVNLADGLDGLASGLCAIAALGFSILTWFSGRQEVAVFGAALVGACIGFLWFNRHPARVFMGDVGALALGGALAGMAVMLNNPLALLGLCLVPFIEALSVMIQVASFKATGKRVFKMSPIHHHFELSGWSERRVVWTFWGVGLIAAAITVMCAVWTAP